MTNIEAQAEPLTGKLSRAEQQALRKAGLKKDQLKDLPPELVFELTAIPLDRCRQIIALHRFQTLDSVGPASAEDLWKLGYRSLDELRTENPRMMYDKLCGITGVRHDPCVEDVFRAVVAQVGDPKLPVEQRNWWYWTRHREGAATGQMGKPDGTDKLSKQPMRKAPKGAKDQRQVTSSGSPRSRARRRTK